MLITMCQWKLISYKTKCTTLVGDVNSKGGSLCAEAEHIGEVYTFLSLLLGTSQCSKNSWLNTVKKKSVAVRATASRGDGSQN